VFKSHGSADAFAFEQALCRAYDAAHNQLLDNVRKRIQHVVPPSAVAPLELISLPTI
jgi:glycerol-3-phosphate acyltransferase PlsX